MCYETKQHVLVPSDIIILFHAYVLRNNAHLQENMVLQICDRSNAMHCSIFLGPIGCCSAHHQDSCFSEISFTRAGNEPSRCLELYNHSKDSY